MFQDILLYQYWLHILLSLSMYTTHCFLALHVFILFPGQWTHFCRQKKKRYIVITFGPKSNLSVISPAKRSRSGPNSVYVDMSRADNVQRILGAIGPLCAKWGLGQVQSFFVPTLCKMGSGTSPEFFCVVIQRSFRQLRNGQFDPNLVTKRSSVSRRGIRKDIFEIHFRGHLPQKSEISQTGTSLRAGYRSRDALQRYCLLHVVVQGPWSFQGRSTFLYDVRFRSYGA